MFHYRGDGKGQRKVFVNGNLINCVIWANEEKGLVCFNPHLKLSKRSKRRGQFYTRILRGCVTVEFC